MEKISTKTIPKFLEYAKFKTGAKKALMVVDELSNKICKLTEGDIEELYYHIMSGWKECFRQSGDFDEKKFKNLILNFNPEFGKICIDKLEMVEFKSLPGERGEYELILLWFIYNRHFIPGEEKVEKIEDVINWAKKKGYL